MVLAVSDALPFRCGMVDCGDGFDWRCADPSFSFWLDEPYFYVTDRGGEWVPVEAVAVYRESGWASFASCLRGRSVAASGRCRPVVVAGRAASWWLRVAVPLVDATVAGVPGRAFEARHGAREARVALDGVAWDLPPEGDVLVRLPYGRGVLCGVGALRGVPDTRAVIDFHEGDVKYVLG